MKCPVCRILCEPSEDRRRHVCLHCGWSVVLRDVGLDHTYIPPSPPSEYRELPKEPPEPSKETRRTEYDKRNCLRCGVLFRPRAFASIRCTKCQVARKALSPHKRAAFDGALAFAGWQI